METPVKEVKALEESLSDLSLTKEDTFAFFDTFREYLFTTNEDEEEIPMDMSQFMKFLDTHNCAYIKEYLFGFWYTFPRVYEFKL